jgi:hypothetical protein
MLVQMSRNSPKYHAAVEAADWSGVLTARRTGAAWDDLRTRTGLSALGRAVIEGSATTVQELLSMGAPTEPLPLNDGALFDPLWAAIEHGSAEVLSLLLEAGANPDRLNEAGTHPLDASEIPEKILLLLRAGSNPNGGRGGIAHVSIEHEPLWRWIEIAAEEKDVRGKALEVIEALIEAGANVTQKGQEGLTSPEFASGLWARTAWDGEGERQIAQRALSKMQAMALNTATEGHKSKDFSLDTVEMSLREQSAAGRDHGRHEGPERL